MITKLEGMICYSVSYDIGTCHTLSHANAFKPSALYATMNYSILFSYVLYFWFSYKISESPETHFSG